MARRLTVIEAALRVLAATGVSHLQQLEKDPTAHGLTAEARPAVRRLRRQRNHALHSHAQPFVVDRVPRGANGIIPVLDPIDHTLDAEALDHAKAKLQNKDKTITLDAEALDTIDHVKAKFQNTETNAADKVKPTADKVKNLAAEKGEQDRE